MSAPQYVPMSPVAQVRSYTSPPRRPEPWTKDRPSEIEARQPHDDRLGVTGPDPGYALTMAARYAGKVLLQREGDAKEVDVLRGAAEIAMKRAALAGRAPILADVNVALTVWGFLDASPAPELLRLRRTMFEGVHHIAPHYPLLRELADAVPAEVLALHPGAIKQRHTANWRSCLSEAAVARVLG